MFSLDSQDESKAKNITPLTKDLKWGLLKKNQTDTSNKHFKCLTEIRDNLCATSDGESIHIWENLVQRTSIILPSDVLIFIERLKLLVSFSNTAPYLFFISINPPYTVRQHPFEFTDIEISFMVSFEQSNILLSSGNGILLTKLKFPDNFKTTNPVPEILQFEKIAHLYKDIQFTNKLHPFVSKNREVFFVQQQNSIYIHQISNGDVIYKINKFPYPGHMLVMYDDIMDTIITATQDCLISQIKFNFKTKEINYDDLDLIMQHKYMIGTPLYVRIYDEFFMIVITNERQLYTISIKTHEILSTETVLEDPIDFIARKNGIYVLCPLNIFEYQTHFFIDFVKSEVGQITRLQRVKSLKNAARIVYTVNDNVLAMISPRTKETLYHFRNQRGMRELIAVSYPRDMESDGETLVSIRNSDELFVLFAQGPILDINLDNVTSYVTNKEIGSFIVPSKHSQSIVLNIPPEMRFFDFVHVDSKKLQNGVCAITKNGFICLFTMTNLHFFNSFHLNLTDVSSVLFSGTTQKLVVSHQAGLSLVDPFLQVCVETIKSPQYSCMKFIDKNKIVCGTTTGHVEIRNFPSLSLHATSTKYNVVHKRVEHIECVDYCAQREVVMSMVKCGEIFVYDSNLYPIAHIDFCFNLTSACFLNGYGTVLLAAFDSLFEISADVLYSKKLVSRSLQYDDFDMRTDRFSMPILSNDDDTKKKQAQKDEKPIWRKSVSFNATVSNKFENLLVDVPVFPKHYFFEKDDRDKGMINYKILDLEAIWKRKKLPESKVALQEEDKDNKNDSKDEKILTNEMKKTKRGNKKKMNLFGDEDDENISINIKKKVSIKRKKNKEGIKSSKSGESFISIKTDEVVVKSKKEKTDGVSIFDRLNRQSAPPKHRQVYKGEEYQIKMNTKTNSSAKYSKSVGKSTFLPKQQNRPPILLPQAGATTSQLQNIILSQKENHHENKVQIIDDETKHNQISNNQEITDSNTHLISEPNSESNEMNNDNNIELITDDNKITENDNIFKVQPPKVEVSNIQPSLDYLYQENPKTTRQSRISANPRLKNRKKKKRKSTTFAPELRVTHIADIKTTGVSHFIEGTNLDADMFTKYVIDGFTTPFGGFKFPIDNNDEFQEDPESAHILVPSSQGRQASLRNPIITKKDNSEYSDVDDFDEQLFITRHKGNPRHHTSKVKEPIKDSSRVRFTNVFKK